VVASRFRLEDLLEDHSGARFWRATDTVLARSVAIHVVDGADPRAPAVLTAARTSATVSDGHILRVLDALEEGGLVHVVHEWGSGVSLDRLLAEEILEPRRAAWLVREVAEAITVAHRFGVAHGRLLPENVLLTDAGSVKLIGFVVDAVLHGRPERPGEEPPSEHEADVLDLGALLYACLTGRWPGFPSSTLPDAPLDHERVCRPRQVRPGVPRQLDALCDRLINPDPRTGRPRYETAAAVVAALSDYLGEPATAASLPVTEPAAFLDTDALRTPRTVGTIGSFDGVPAPTGSGGEAVTDTGSDPWAEAEADADGDATQPGLPRLDDSDPALAPFASEGAGIRMGAGEVPAVWGPERSDDTGAWAGADERAGASWWRLAALIGVVVLVLLAIVVGFYLGRTGGENTAEPAPPRSSGPRTGQPVAVQAVADFDPDQAGGGVPEENPDLVPLATDKDPATAWQSVTYEDGPVLAPYKAGVGLLLDLGSETEVGEVAVTLVGSPYDVQLLAAAEGAPAPTGVAGLVTVDTRSGAGGDVVLSGDQTVVTRYLVVWLTALPPAGGGFRGGVAEIAVRS
jgi:hypothetical protein